MVSGSGGVAHHLIEHSPKAPKGHAGATPTPQNPTPSANINLQPVDNQYPWTHITNEIGSNGTPKIEALVAKGQSQGWKFTGNGQGGGVGAILSVRTPDGQIFTDNGHIDAALDYLNIH